MTVVGVSIAQVSASSSETFLFPLESNIVDCGSSTVKLSVQNNNCISVAVTDFRVHNRYDALLGLILLDMALLIWLLLQTSDVNWIVALYTFANKPGVYDKLLESFKFCPHMTGRTWK